MKAEALSSGEVTLGGRRRGSERGDERADSLRQQYADRGTHGEQEECDTIEECDRAVSQAGLSRSPGGYREHHEEERTAFVVVIVQTSRVRETISYHNAFVSREHA